MISEESKRKMGWRKGKSFTAYMVECKWCKQQFKTVPTSTKQHTCSRKCYSEFLRSQRDASFCEICKVPIQSIKSRKKRFCSNKCRTKVLGQTNRILAAKRSSWGQWLNRKSAKLWFIQQYKGCMKCGYNNVLGILELHHIDRNGKNNIKENLMLLCPNCHSEDHWIKKDGQFANNRGRHAINS
jgi:hypothetical protein